MKGRPNPEKQQHHLNTSLKIKIKQTPTQRVHSIHQYAEIKGTHSLYLMQEYQVLVLYVNSLYLVYFLLQVSNVNFILSKQHLQIFLPKNDHQQGWENSNMDLGALKFEILIQPSNIVSQGISSMNNFELSCRAWKMTHFPTGSDTCYCTCMQKCAELKMEMVSLMATATWPKKASYLLFSLRRKE